MRKWEAKGVERLLRSPKGLLLTVVVHFGDREKLMFLPPCHKLVRTRIDRRARTARIQEMPFTYAVTGATGFIASHIIRVLLSRGHVVHGTVRSLRDRHRFLHLLPAPPPLSVVEALPLEADGSLLLAPSLRLFEADLLAGPAPFSPAFSGCAAVVHAASPYDLSASKEEQMAPALAGTLAVLRAAEGLPCVRRVVLTSSAAAVYVGGPARPADHVHSGADFSDEGALEAAASWYALGKLRAEKAAWAFVGSEEHAGARAARGAPPLSLAAVCPTQCLGPLLEPAGGAGAPARRANQSSLLLLEYLNGSKKTLPAKGKCLVDVRDVAEAHALAAAAPAGAWPVGGGPERYLLVAGSLPWRAISEAARAAVPGARVPLQVDAGPPSAPQALCSTRAEWRLGVRYRPMEDSVEDAARSLVAQGYLVL